MDRRHGIETRERGTRNEERGLARAPHYALRAPLPMALPDLEKIGRRGILAPCVMRDKDVAPTFHHFRMARSAMPDWDILSRPFRAARFSSLFLPPGYGLLATIFFPSPAFAQDTDSDLMPDSYENTYGCLMPKYRGYGCGWLTLPAGLR